MVHITDCRTPARERLSWLTCLIGDYKRLYGISGGERTDEDPEATGEMIREVEALANELESALPPIEPPAPPVHAIGPRIGFYTTGMGMYRHWCGVTDTEEHQYDGSTDNAEVTCSACRIALGIEEPLPF